MNRPLRVGDRVQATGTVTKVDTSAKHISVRFDGTSAPNGFYSEDMDALTLITPVEPPVGSVVVKDGVAYLRDKRDKFEREPCQWWNGDDTWVAWHVISDGDVIFAAGGDA